jgi:hypothetical protein
MGKIDLTRVFLGGLVAGIVVLVGDTILALSIPTIIKWLPAQWDAIPLPTLKSLIIYCTIEMLVGGPLAIWLYAAIRPRFGPGPKTAVYAGLWIWVVLGPYMQTELIASGYPNAFSFGLWVFLDAVALPTILLAMIAGAWVYKEQTTTVATSAAAR